MENIYNYILSGLAHYIMDSDTQSSHFAQYLHSLKPYIRQLRDNYNTGNNVKVSYNCHQIQASYMIAYYPHYVEMTEVILNELFQRKLLKTLNENIENQLFNIAGKLNVSIFAAGAVPEVVALCKYIKVNFPKEDYGNIQGQLNIQTFDLSYSEWASSRFLTRFYILPKYYPISNLILTPHPINLVDQAGILNFEKEIQESHLIIFQNCLNELAQNKESNFLDNFNYILNTSKPRSSIIISDLSSYNIAQKLISRITSLSVYFSRLGILAKLNPMFHYSKITLPKVLTDNLLNGENGLKPRRKTKYMFLFLEKLPQEVCSYFNEGNRKLNSFFLNEAIIQYTKALELAPHFYVAYTRRGLAYRKNKEYEKAINDYTKAFNLCTKKAEDYYHRSLAYRQLKKYQEAIADCNEVIHLNPNLAAAYNHLGNLYFDLENYQSAIDNYNQAINCDYNFAIAYNNRGVAYSKLNRYDQARKSYDIAIKLKPNYTKAIQNRKKVSSL